jgi:hypothetical protein
MFRDEGKHVSRDLVDGGESVLHRSCQTQCFECIAFEGFNLIHRLVSCCAEPNACFPLTSARSITTLLPPEEAPCNALLAADSSWDMDRPCPGWGSPPSMGVDTAVLVWRGWLGTSIARPLIRGLIANDDLDAVSEAKQRQ